MDTQGFAKTRPLILRYISIVLLGIGGYYALFWAVHPILIPPQGLYDGNWQHLIQDRYPFHLIAPAWVSDSSNWMIAETLARLCAVVVGIICAVIFIRKSAVAQFLLGHDMRMTMKIPRFKTDRRLWFWIAVALFMTIWCIPFMDMKEEATSPFDIFHELFNDLIHGSLPIGNTVSGFGGLAVLAFYLGIPSVILAWVIQCVVVIIRTKLRDKKLERIDHVA